VLGKPQGNFYGVPLLDFRLKNIIVRNLFDAHVPRPVGSPRPHALASLPSPTAVRLIGEALSVPQDEKPGPNDRAVFASKFEGVTTLARHSLSQAVRRIVTDEKFAEKLAPFTPHDLRRTGATLAQAARLPVDFVKALLNHNDKGVTGIYARWHMFEEKREAVMAIEAAVSPLMPVGEALAA